MKLVGCLLFGTIVLSANTINFNYQEVGSFHSEGVYNLVGLDTWNGQPVSVTNMPTPYQARLADNINFFVSPSSPNDLFIQVTDVVTTNASYWSGTASNNVALTGIRFRLFPYQSVNLGIPSFSDDYANPGEVMFTGNGGETIPLTNTPGYMLEGAGMNAYTISTVNGSQNAFGTWSYVNGETRIMGGGIFELGFNSSVNLLTDVDFADTTIDSIFGQGNQYISGEPVTVTPEPASIRLFGTALAFAALLTRRRTAA